MDDLGRTLRRAREAAGLSLAGMARRTGFSRSYLGNVETGVRPVTPGLIKAYERALGEDVRRRSVLFGMVGAVTAAALPDVAVDVVRDIAAERSRLLASVQTTHETDRVIGSLIAQDAPSIAPLCKWMINGPPILRVNAAGILAKVGSSTIDDQVVRALSTDREARDLYLTAVLSRVLGIPWDEAARLAHGSLAEPDHLAAVAAEAAGPKDSGARWCSILMLARSRNHHPGQVNDALASALKVERSRENLRAIAGALAGLDPVMI